MKAKKYLDNHKAKNQKSKALKGLATKGTSKRTSLYESTMKVASNTILDNVSLMLDTSSIAQFKKQESEIYTNLKQFLPNEFLTSIKAFTEIHNTFLLQYAAFTESPTLKLIKELDKTFKELEKEKQAFEDNYFYDLEKQKQKELENKLEQKQKELEATELAYNKLLEDYNESKKLLSIIHKVSLPKNAKKQKPVKKIYSLKPNFENAKYQIEQIFETSKPLFNSSLEQWQNLFAKEIKQAKKPIELKSNTSIVDLSLLFHLLYTDKEKFIYNSYYNSIIERFEIFSKDGKTITNKQLTNAKQTLKTNNPRNYDLVKSIIKMISTN